MLCQTDSGSFQNEEAVARLFSIICNEINIAKRKI